MMLSKDRKKILVVFGTRPEAIKMAPVIKELKAHKQFECNICITSQHKELLHPILDFYNIHPEFDLNLMTKNQSLSFLSGDILKNIQNVFEKFSPDFLMVHGDTTTTFSAALAAFYNKISVLHIEAGLRTRDLTSPWPEEANRRLTSILTAHHFAPTEIARNNLLKEGVNEKNVTVTGNTVVDAIQSAEKIITSSRSISESLRLKFRMLSGSKKNILVTCHRRENFGENLKNICNTIRSIASERNDVNFIFPVHPNPNINQIVYEVLGYQPNVYLLPPQNYLDFVFLMMNSYFILSDSGGIQEEAPSLGKPVLVLRDETERPEALKSGNLLLVGSNPTIVKHNILSLLDSASVYSKMCEADNPFGDGNAASRIAAVIKTLVLK